MSHRTLPYGTWPSPITPALAVGSAHGLSGLRLDRGDMYVLEARPEEAGRTVLMRLDADGRGVDVVPPELNVRTRVHEYGGGAYAVRDGIVVLSEFVGNRLMHMPGPEAAPVSLTDDARLRFADLEIDTGRGRVLAVMEDQRAAADEVRNLIVAVDLAGGGITELAADHDFVSDPRLDPDGQRLAWLSWDHPRMPWDGTDLWVAGFETDGTLTEPRHVAGGSGESIVQPTWAPDGSLVFSSDRDGWWNLHRWRDGASGPSGLTSMKAEIGGPMWVFGQRWFAIDADGTIVLSARSRGRDRLFVLAPDAPLRPIELEATSIEDVAVADGVATFIAGAPTRPSAIMRVDLASGRHERVREADALIIDPAYLSQPRHITFPTAGGAEAHAWYYGPHHPEIAEPADEAPPLVVMTHGGPTSSAGTELSLLKQAFTSRGFAVVDVDYRGSTGYGRAYRDALRGRWGVHDVDDTQAAAEWLVGEGLADPDRLAIRGGSAGGYTTLAALAFRDTFHAGASHYGVGDLRALAEHTHKFESRYLDALIGPLPEAAAVYRARSPVHHVDRIACPVLVLQGEDDLVVPQAQADEIVAALARRGLPRAYLLFPGEGHGFRIAENRERALAAELSFYAQVFGFDLADDVEPLVIEGLEAHE